VPLDRERALAPRFVPRDRAAFCVRAFRLLFFALRFR
jgi:hypothetical protein